MSDEATLAVVVARLDDVRHDLANLGTRLDASARAQVGRGEWEQRNRAVDARFEGQGREIAQLRTTLAGQRAPWWSVGALVVSAAAFAFQWLGG